MTEDAFNSEQPMTRKQLRALQRQQEANGEPITEYVAPPAPVVPPVVTPAPTFETTPAPAYEAPVAPAPTSAESAPAEPVPSFTASTPVSRFIAPSQPVEPPAPAPSPNVEQPTATVDSGDALFRIPTNLTGEIATASIVIDNPTSPLDVLAAAATGSIPIKTGSIDVQLPEARTSVASPVAAEPDTDTGSIAQVITPLKSQNIAISGELGHQRRLNIRPIDSQKYWVLGTGIFMVTAGAGVLWAYLMGYFN